MFFCTETLTSKFDKHEIFFIHEKKILQNKFSSVKMLSV